MSFNTTPTDDVYIVYVPHESMVVAYPFSMPKEARVRDLTKAIRDDPEIEPYLEDKSLSLFMCGELSEDSENLYDKAVNWLRDHEETHRLSPSTRLKTHFPDRPAREEDEKIDVIAVTNSLFDIHCVVYVPYGAQAAAYPFRVPKDARVRDLVRAIRGDRELNPHLDETPLSLFKCGTLSMDSKNLYEEVLTWLHGHKEHELIPAHRLNKHFPSGPPLSDAEVIDVIAVTESILRGLVAGMTGSEDLWTRFYKEMDHAISALAPSMASKPSEMRGEQMARPLYNGRPDELRGPPIAIYHNVFAKLKDDLAKLDAIQVTANELNTTHQLFVKSAAFYQKEHNRIDETINLWELLLVQTISVTALRGGGAEADGGVTVDLSPGQRALLGAFEWKLELGSTGDAGYQGACTYRKFLTQKTYAKLLMSTCSPCLIIGVMGPYFCIMGAIFVDVVIVEPFTEWIFLGGKPDGRVTTVARILKATADAFRGLKDYYQNVALTDKADDQVRLPKPTMIEGPLQPPTLQYVNRLDRKNMARPLYSAQMGDRPVVVKFPDRYSEEAHKILADEGLAPKLHFCGRIKGGLWMIVMDLVIDVVHNDFSMDTLPHGAYEDVERAIGLLHERDLVFGDLRRPNVIVVDRETNEGKKGALLVDFDWCGKEGEARYPDTLNDTSDIDWALGVERCGLMKKEHDLFRLQKLMPS